MTVTFLLPVHNGAATLPSAIESVLGQSDSDLVLLVIDDHSSDNSASIAASYAERDSRVHLVRHAENRGLPWTLNEGLALAETDLVARIDHDDLALPERLVVQRAFMEAHPNVAVAGSDVLHMGRTPKDDRRVRLPSTPRQVAMRLQVENCLYHPSVIVRRRQLLDLGGYRESFRNAEDYDLWLRASRRYDLANIPQALVRYRFSVGGQTLARKWEQLFYVTLAQVANRHPSATFDELRDTTRAMLASVDRTQFMQHVARTTVEELVALGLRRDAMRLISVFAADIGPRATAALAYHVFGGRSRAAKSPLKPSTSFRAPVDSHPADG